VNNKEYAASMAALQRENEGQLAALTAASQVISEMTAEIAALKAENKEYEFSVKNYLTSKDEQKRSAFVEAGCYLKMALQEDNAKTFRGKIVDLSQSFDRAAEILTQARDAEENI